MGGRIVALFQINRSTNKCKEISQKYIKFTYRVRSTNKCKELHEKNIKFTYK